ARGQQQQCEQWWECLVSHGVFCVHAQRGRGSKRNKDHPAGRCQAPPCPIPQPREHAVKPVKDFQDQIHAGTLVFFNTSSTTLRAVNPEKRACGCMTSRCAITGPARAWICSGVTNSRPSNNASACAAF